MDEFLFQITEEYEGERIDRCMAMLLDSLSRSYIQKLIKEGQVLVNGMSVKSSYQVQAEDEVRFSLPPSQEPQICPEHIPLAILYEDKDLLVINKPKGMVVHPAAGHYSGTLVNGVMHHCGEELSGINGVMRPGIVHRIDMDTTGSLIVCKNDKSHNSIAAQLKAHSITRRYRAICHGVIEAQEGTVDRPVGRHPTDRRKMAVNEKNGKHAVTHYRVLRRFREYTYIECELETGRTHQIRVHMARTSAAGRRRICPGQEKPLLFTGADTSCHDHRIYPSNIRKISGDRGPSARILSASVGYFAIIYCFQIKFVV